MVNVKSKPSIGKDQCLTFLHLLNNRHEGYRIPRTIPTSLKATFNKEQIDYNVSRTSIRPNRPSDDRSTSPSYNTTSTTTTSNKKSAFADGYLSRLGFGSEANNSKGTDFTSVRDTDWEEVRLKRLLADLNKKYADAEAEMAKNKSGGGDAQRKSKDCLGEA